MKKYLKNAKRPILLYEYLPWFKKHIKLLLKKNLVYQGFFPLI